MGLSSVPIREAHVSSQSKPLPELRIASSPVRGDYSRLLQATIRLRKTSPQAGIAIGFTGVRSGAGVSYALDGFAKDLTRHSGESVLTTSDCPFPDDYPATDIDWPAVGIQYGRAGLGPFRIEPGDKNSGGNRSWLKAARERFSYVLVDCAPPSISGEILSLGPELDGIVLVVSSGQARREEVRNTVTLIQSSGGLLIGLVLNRYRSALPWRQV